VVGGHGSRGKPYRSSADSASQRPATSKLIHDAWTKTKSGRRMGEWMVEKWLMLQKAAAWGHVAVLDLQGMGCGGARYLGAKGRSQML